MNLFRLAEIDCQMYVFSDALYHLWHFYSKIFIAYVYTNIFLLLIDWLLDV